METKYYAYSVYTTEGDTYDIGIYNALEEANREASDYRTHLTPHERLSHHTVIEQLYIFPYVDDLDSLFAYVEITGNRGEIVDEWTVYCLDELRDLAYNLDYEEWYDPTREADCLDLLRTNWNDGKLTEGAVMIVFEIIKARWEEDHREDGV